MSKINKSLDYNKLLAAQAQGKMKNKILSFPLYAEIKYDGNYVTVRVESGIATFTTSGGLNYTHTDSAGDFFNNLSDGVYIAERIGRDGRLGTRRYCNLRGSKSAQTSTGHSYRVHDFISLTAYDLGETKEPYKDRLFGITDIPLEYQSSGFFIFGSGELDDHLDRVVNTGYEGLMLKDPEWRWRDTKSRKIECAKYKKRPTADLLCIGTLDGGGKYEGLLGSLLLVDSKGRKVYVGSGLSDSDRHKPTEFFTGKVIEVEYEQIIDTYIQPTFIQIRDDKTKEEID